jgi:hypothetical protein
MTYDPSCSFTLNLLIVAKPAQPLHLRLAVKPRHLALGVIPVSLPSG